MKPNTPAATPNVPPVPRRRLNPWWVVRSIIDGALLFIVITIAVNGVAWALHAYGTALHAAWVGCQNSGGFAQTIWTRRPNECGNFFLIAFPITTCVSFGVCIGAARVSDMAHARGKHKWLDS